MNIKIRLCLWMIMLCLAVSWSPALPDTAQTPSHILIIPFEIHTNEELSFLQRGVADIISSILSADADIVAIKPQTHLESISDEAVGQADFRLEGSITVFGEQVSTNASLTEIHTGNTVLNFHEIGQQRGDVLKHAEMLAALIKTQIKGDTTDETPSIKDPPDTLPTLLQTNPINTRIISIASGDINGNQQNEILCASTDRLYFYRLVQGQLSLIGEHYIGRFQTIIGIDAADISGDGKAEIFVTAKNSQGNISSFAAQWNGSELVILCKNLPYYFRGIYQPGHGIILFGQRSGRPDPTGELALEPWQHLFQQGIYRMEKRKGCYEAGIEYQHSSLKTLYGFTKGAINAKFPEVLISYSARDTIQVEQANNSIVWESERHQGGGVVYLEYPNLELGAGSMSRYYLHPRIYLVDYNNDGTNKIVVQKNIDMGKRLVARFRSYQHGSLEFYVWNHDHLQRIKQIGPYSGYISDFVVADINGDRKLEVVFALITSKGSLLKTEISTIKAVRLE